MGRITRSAPRSIAATLLFLGCAPTPGSPPAHTAPIAVLPAAWAVMPCAVVDSSAPTADTLWVVGGDYEEADSAPSSYGCAGVRASVDRPPPVIARIEVGMQGGVRDRDPYPGELRDVLDGMRLSSGAILRADVMVTRDEDVAAYGARLGYVTAVLPWTQTYVLVPASPNTSGAIPSVAERVALARDAVTFDARGAAEPFSWLTDTACAAAIAKPSATPRAVIAYRAGDSAAKQIAERIVALAGGSPVPPWIAAVLGSNASAATPRIAAFRGDSIYGALESGAASAAVLPILRDPRSACATDANDRVTSGSVPLIDVRAHVLVRRGSGAAFVITPDGVLHFFRRDSR